MDNGITISIKNILYYLYTGGKNRPFQNLKFLPIQTAAPLRKIIQIKRFIILKIEAFLEGSIIQNIIYDVPLSQPPKYE